MASAWVWNGSAYMKSWSCYSEPERAAFATVHERQMLCTVDRDLVARLHDARTGLLCGPPKLLTKNASVQFAAHAPILGIVEQNGRVSMQDPMFDPGLGSASTAEALLPTEQPLFKAFIRSGSSALTSTCYTPLANVRRELVLWNIEKRAPVWRWTGEEAPTWARPETIEFAAVATDDRAIAAVVKTKDGYELFLFQRNKDGLDLPVRRVPFLYREPDGKSSPAFSNPRLKFCRNDRLLFVEDADNTRMTEVPTTAQGTYSIPADRVWALKSLRLDSMQVEAADPGTAIPVKDSFLCFSADGMHFITCNREEGSYALWEKSAGSKQLGRVAPAFGIATARPEVAEKLFSVATTLRSLPSGEIAGILPGGGEALIGSGG